MTAGTCPSVRIERIVSDGHTSPERFWYDQDQPEWVVILEDAARLHFEDKIMELKPGSVSNIPAQAAPGRLDHAGRAHDLRDGFLRVK